MDLSFYKRQSLWLRSPRHERHKGPGEGLGLGEGGRQEMPPPPQSRPRRAAQRACRGRCPGCWGDSAPHRHRGPRRPGLRRLCRPGRMSLRRTEGRGGHGAGHRLTPQRTARRSHPALHSRPVGQALAVPSAPPPGHPRLLVPSCHPQPLPSSCRTSRRPHRAPTAPDAPQPPFGRTRLPPATPRPRGPQFGTTQSRRLVPGCRGPPFTPIQADPFYSFCQKLGLGRRRSSFNMQHAERTEEPAARGRSAPRAPGGPGAPLTPSVPSTPGVAAWASRRCGSFPGLRLSCC